MFPSYEDPSKAGARLAAIVESSQDAIISKNLQGVIETWNAAAERIYGYSAPEIIGSPMTRLLPADRTDEEADILAQIRRGERVQHFETKRVRKDGTVIDVALTISPIYDQNGVISGASHIARDITERKRFEAQLRQAQRLESLGVLAGGIAHDFNNLLTGIVGPASLISEMLAPNSAAHALLDDVLSTAHRLSALTQQLLAYPGESSLIFKPLNVSSVVREIAGLIGAAIPRGIELRLELDDRLPEISGDATQIQQVAMNLIINAAEASDKPGACVTARTYSQEVDEHYIRTVLAPDEVAPGKYVCLEIEDNGKGMDPATQARIFDPFFTTKIKGRGLGLAAVLGIVRAHAGALKVYPKIFEILISGSASAGAFRYPGSV